MLKLSDFLNNEHVMTNIINNLKQNENTFIDIAIKNIIKNNEMNNVCEINNSFNFTSADEKKLSNYTLNINLYYSKNDNKYLLEARLFNDTKNTMNAFLQIYEELLNGDFKELEEYVDDVWLFLGKWELLKVKQEQL